MWTPGQVWTWFFFLNYKTKWPGFKTWRNSVFSYHKKSTELNLIIWKSSKEIYEIMLWNLKKNMLLWAIPKWNISLLQWYRLIKSAEYLCEFSTGKTEFGVGQKGRRGRQRVMDLWSERRSVGYKRKWHGLKWPLVKWNTWVFLST